MCLVYHTASVYGVCPYSKCVWCVSSVPDQSNVCLVYHTASAPVHARETTRDTTSECMCVSSCMCVHVRESEKNADALDTNRCSRHKQRYGSGPCKVGIAGTLILTPQLLAQSYSRSPTQSHCPCLYHMHQHTHREADTNTFAMER